MSEQRITLVDVCRTATDEGEYINGELHVVVKSARPPEGKRPSKATVFDPESGQEAKLAYFAASLVNYEGKVISISGKGNKAKTYKGDVEISIGKNGILAVVGDYASTSGRPTGSAAAPAASTPPPRNEPPPKLTPSENATRFHKRMKTIALGYLHAFQYARDVVARLESGGLKVELEQFQAMTSSIFIKADRDGLFDSPPAPREWNDKTGFAFPYVPPAPDPEAAAKAKEEADRRAREAAERAAEEERKKHAATQAQNLDEDVPF